MATVGDGGEDRTQMPRTSSLQVEAVVIEQSMSINVYGQCLCSLLNDHLNIIMYLLKPFFLVQIIVLQKSVVSLDKRVKGTI